MDNTFFVVTHNRIENLKFPYNYKRLSVNKNLTGADYYDNVGIEISNLNKYFCELTALYWIWKNYESVNVGLCHYRRYFVSTERGLNIISTSECDNILESYDIIVPRKAIFNYNLKINYANSHHFKDLKNAVKILLFLHPEYKNTVNSVLKSNILYSFNMFYMSKKNLDKYCAWLFEILFRLYQKKYFKNYSDYEKRVFGFLSERLFTIWIIYNRFKIYEMDVAFLNSDNKFNLINFSDFMKRNRFKEYLKYIINRTFNNNFWEPKL